MIVGAPKEIKQDEFRVAMTPPLARNLVEAGHRVLVERGAGVGAGIEDPEFLEAGAEITSAEEVWRGAELICKVKEPQPSEWPRIAWGQLLFMYFHFAASRELLEAMIESGAICIAMETIETDDGRHPLLVPMSEIAGRLAILEGAKWLQTPMGGRGLLLAGITGAPPVHVVVFGAGTVGVTAARTSASLGGRVTLLDVNLNRLREIAGSLPRGVEGVYASPSNIRELLPSADLVIGAAHRVGGKAPSLLSRKDLGLLPKGAVLVDVAIDQGGCFETSRPTHHTQPTYEVDGIIHYCVPNMPGCVARTSTLALINASAPFIRRIADLGFPEVIRRDSALRRAVNVFDGKVTHAAVARDFQLRHVPIEDFLLHSQR